MPYVKRRMPTKRATVKSRKIYKKRVYKRSSTTLKALVKKEISRNIENKSVSTDPVAYTFNAVNTTCSPAVSLTFPALSISQGTGDGTRIGNKINIKRAVINMNFTCSTQNASDTGPFYVMFYIGRLKQDPAATPAAADLLKLLNDGSGSTGLTNSTLTMLRNINRDYFTISATRKFKLGMASSLSAVTTYPNNDFPLNRQFKISLKSLLGPLTFDDNNTTRNKFLYLWAHVIQVNSTATTSAPVVLEYYVDINYEDA